MGIPFVENLKPAEYIGTKNLSSDKLGLMQQAFRVDFSGLYDFGFIRYNLTKKIESAIPKNIFSIKVERGTSVEEYAGHMLVELMNDINEKGTKSIILKDLLVEEVKVFDKQVASSLNNSTKKPPALNLNNSYLLLLSKVELFFYILLSTLDLYAKLSQVFNNKAPSKFGQQLSITKQNKDIWDKEYQDFLRSQKELDEWLKEYRHIFAHEHSLKIRFTKINEEWRSVIVKDYLSNRGLLLPDILEILVDKFVNYSLFFDDYFSKKVARLNKLVKDNLL